ncbi:hypothetical protein GCM10007880_63360 [Mesorhizobium amorphae]|nr:hypothetical protein GCM10007880_63360 [Mesorhizobium amorphae]
MFLSVAGLDPGSDILTLQGISSPIGVAQLCRVLTLPSNKRYRKRRRW